MGIQNGSSTRRFAAGIGIVLLVLLLAGAVAYFVPRLFPDPAVSWGIDYTPRLTETESCPPPTSVLSLETSARAVICFEITPVEGGGSQLVFEWPEDSTTGSVVKDIEQNVLVSFDRDTVVLTLHNGEYARVVPSGYEEFLLEYDGAKDGSYYTLVYKKDLR